MLEVAAHPDFPKKVLCEMQVGHFVTNNGICQQHREVCVARAFRIYADCIGISPEARVRLFFSRDAKSPYGALDRLNSIFSRGR